VQGSDKMQVQNIQRPALYIDFFGLELLWNNEYLTYIQTTINAVTSNLCNIAKITTDNIKKSLKNKNIKSVLIKDTCIPYPYPERTIKAIESYLESELSKQKYLEQKKYAVT
jgi:hypothetical protein